MAVPRKGAIARKRRRRAIGRVAAVLEPPPRSNGLHPGGRPPEYQPSFAVVARRLCSILGATDSELAEFFGVSVGSITHWKLDHSEFLSATTITKAQADDLVEKRLYLRATGYEHKSVKIFLPPGAAEPVYAPYTEHYPPDTAAMMFWLKNRRPEAWRDLQKQEITIDAQVSEGRRKITGVLTALLDARARGDLPDDLVAMLDALDNQPQELPAPAQRGNPLIEGKKVNGSGNGRE